MMYKKNPWILQRIDVCTLKVTWLFRLVCQVVQVLTPSDTNACVWIEYRTGCVKSGVDPLAKNSRVDPLASYTVTIALQDRVMHGNPIACPYQLCSARDLAITSSELYTPASDVTPS